MMPEQNDKSGKEMLRTIARRLLAAFLLLFLAAVSAYAQTGRIFGTVADQQGNPINVASVHVVNQDTQDKKETTSDANGAYAVLFLPAGNYQVTVESAGFSPTTSPVIPLAAAQASEYNAQLSIEGATANVVVNGGSVANSVELDTASISTTLSTQQVTSFGLNGRNVSQLLTMAPGVSNQSGQDEAKVGVAGSAKFSVNGGRVEYNSFEVDGSDVLNTSINASRGQGLPLMVYPSIDAIEEMKVLTSNYSALYGKSASGSVLITTKSGTDKFHGSAYDFLRNELFNARNYFDQPNPVPLGYQGKLTYRTPLYRRQDFGGTIGGPLFIPHIYDRNVSKTFFFFSEEVRREKTPVEYNQAVPTMAERGLGAANPGIGDFSDVCPTPAPGSANTLNATKNPDCPRNGNVGNNVPQPIVTESYISQGILNTGIIPEPNAVSGCNTTNPTPFLRCYVASVSPPTHWREELFRIDHDLTLKEILSFRYIHDAWDTVTLTPQWGIVQNSFPTVENQLNGPGQDMVFTLTQSLPHGFLNRVAVAYVVQHISLVSQPGPGLSSLARPAILDSASPSVTMNEPNVTSSTAIPNGAAPLCSNVTGQTQTIGGFTQTLTECPMGYIFNNGFGGNKMPGLVFQGTNGAYGGHGFAVDTGYAPWNQANPTFTLRDDANKLIGKHNLEFGFEGTYVQQNQVSAVSGANSGDLQGLLTFSNQQSRYTSGNAFADFLYGPGVWPINSQTGALTEGLTQTGIKSYTQDSAQGKYYNRYKMAEFYVQDDWQILPRLTLNAGFRASLFGGWYNPQNTAYNWRPEDFSQSLGGSIQVDANYGYLVRTATGSPVPLNLSSLDPVITNGLVQCGKSAVPSGCLNNSPFHPAPRFGFSWDPFGDGKTAIRGGYGLFWEHGTGDEANVGSLIGSAPLVLSETQSNISWYPATGGAANGSVGAYNAIGFSCQQGMYQCGSLPVNPGGTTYPLNVASIPTKAVYSYAQQWSLSVQRQLKQNLIMQVAYVGTKGTHLTAVRDLNQLPLLSSSLNPFLPGQPITASVCSSGVNPPYAFSTQGVNSTNPPPPGGITSSTVIGPLSPGYVNMVVACTGNIGFEASGSTPLGISADNVRPYPGFSNIISIDNIADSEYDALQSTLRATTGSLTLGVAYTYSHSLDDSSDRASQNFANSLDIHANHASSDSDQRDLLNVNYVYDLPFLKLLQGFNHLVGSGSDSASASSWTPSSALKLWLGNWQLSGVTAFETGTPFSVVNGGGGDGTGTLDNAGVGDGIGIGSFADLMPGASAHGQRPYVPIGSQNVGPLLLNPGAFIAPRGLTFGDSGRNLLRNPTRTNFNMALLKHFKPFGENPDFEFRAEAFNIFNHTQFRIYDPTHPGNTGNNVINCYGDITTQYSAGASGCLNGNSFLHPVDAHDPRILQFALKLGF
jgi:hypothetical protein